MRKSLRALALAAGVAAAGRAAAENGANPAAKPIAVLDFDYRDTSGEARDQGAEHRARLGAFMAKLRADLGADPRFPVVSIACVDTPCTAANPPLEALMDAARKAGAHALPARVLWRGTPSHGACPAWLALSDDRIRLSPADGRGRIKQVLTTQRHEREFSRKALAKALAAQRISFKFFS